MKLGIIINTNDPETAWNALRLGNKALGAGNRVRVFLLSSGVEIDLIEDGTFDVGSTFRELLDRGGDITTCGTCLEVRHQQAGVCPDSTMADLIEMISDSDKVVTFG